MISIIAKGLRDLIKKKEPEEDDVKDPSLEVELWNKGDLFEDSLVPLEYPSVGYRGPHNDREKRRVIERPTKVMKAPRAVPR